MKKTQCLGFIWSPNLSLAYTGRREHSRSRSRWDISDRQKNGKRRTLKQKNRYKSAVNKRGRHRQMRLVTQEVHNKMTPSGEGLGSFPGLVFLGQIFGRPNLCYKSWDESLDYKIWAKFFPFFLYFQVAQICAIKVGPNFWAQIYTIKYGQNVKAPKLSSQQTEHSSISLAGPCQVRSYRT